MIDRRSLLSFPFYPAFSAALVPLSRISFITDEVSSSQRDAIVFARRYRLQWVELRNIPGRKQGYWDLPQTEQTAALRQLEDNGLRVSFIDSGLLACPIPGTEPIRKPGPQESARFTNRMEELRKVVDFAQRARCNKIRCFTFRRVAEPEALFPRIAELIAPLAEYAAGQGVRLLFENESSCNVNTSSEIAAFLQLLPDANLNWDPGNASNQELAFPDGYRRIPIRRIGNVQIKGKSILGSGDGTDWPALFSALFADGYSGHFALETHTSNRVADSPAAIERILQIAAGKI